MSGAASASPLRVVLFHRDDPRSLAELENETRILLPGTVVFLGFLTTLPFTTRFGSLDESQKLVYAATFFSTLLAVAFFMAPAAYHRVARPIRHKERFKLFANVFLVIGLVPASLSFVFASYLVCSLVYPRVALPAAALMGVLVVTLWWLIPLLRLHDRFHRSANRGADHAGHAAE